MFDRLRQSLALRLAVQYAAVFALALASLFAIFYWLIGRALEQRDQATITRQAESLANAYEFGGPQRLRIQLESDTSAEAGTFFVRLVNPDGSAGFLVVPPQWIEKQVQQIPLLGLAYERPVVKVPQDELRDYTIAQRPLSDGRLLQVGRLTDSRRVLLAPLRPIFVIIGGSVLVASAGLGMLLAWRATRPLRAVADTARQILATGDLAARVPAPAGRDELALLVRQLNTLLDKNATHVRVLREMVDNLAHDLRTPLTRLRGTAELALQGGADPAEAREALADCVEESERVLHLLDALLDISSAEAGALALNKDRIDARSVTERAADLYREVADEKKIALTLEQPEAAELSADAVRLGQAINNLVDNALKYTPPGGEVKIVTRAEPRTIVITITDNGPGIPVAEREAIFRRLYRGDASRSQRGLGLGLSLVKAIVEAHGGTVVAADAPSRGARFIVRLPR